MRWHNVDSALSPLARVHADIATHLVEIEGLFKGRRKCTVIVRNPENDEEDVLVSNDSIDGIRQAVERAAVREEQTLNRR